MGCLVLLSLLSSLPIYSSLYSSNESEYQLSSPPNPGQMVVIWTEDNYWYRSIVIEQQAKDMFKVTLIIIVLIKIFHTTITMLHMYSVHSMLCITKVLAFHYLW